jgi:hypothetical protein
MAAVDWNSLLESVAGSIVAGLGITTALSIGLLGLIRANEAREDGRPLQATIAAGIGALGLLVAIAGTMIGLVIVASDNALA